jgi:hypothetical protein
MYAISDAPAVRYLPPPDTDTDPLGSNTYPRQPQGSGPQVVPTMRPAGFRPGTAGTQTVPGAANNHQFKRAGLDDGIIVNRPANMPPGAPATTPLVTRAEDSPNVGNLPNYRVDPGNLGRLQPDRHGIYTRNNAGGNKTYFAKIGGNVYQVGGFDRSTTSWRVLDPKSGNAVFKLVPEGGKWKPKELASASRQYPQGAWGRVFRALDAGIDNVKQAKGELRGAWSNRTSASMRKLYGGGAFQQVGKARIEAGFDGTLRAMEKTKREGGRNLSITSRFGPYGPSAAAHADGRIEISSFSLGGNWTADDLNELMVHEHTHTGAGTTDHWYLNAHHDRLPNWRGSVGHFTFNNAVNNADTLARSTSVLINNWPVSQSLKQKQVLA